MEHHRKHSRKRDAILECVRSTDCHPTAEWVYARLKPRIPDLSLGTVYRNLALFRQEGRICSVGTVDGRERFDGNSAPHAHFVCRHCGAVLDLPPVALPEAPLPGAEVCSAEVTFRGLCPDCAKK